jgi:hypothetical protein
MIAIHPPMPGKANVKNDVTLYGNFFLVFFHLLFQFFNFGIFLDCQCDQRTDQYAIHKLDAVTEILKRTQRPHVRKSIRLMMMML